MALAYSPPISPPLTAPLRLTPKTPRSPATVQYHATSLKTPSVTREAHAPRPSSPFARPTTPAYNSTPPLSKKSKLRPSPLRVEPLCLRAGEVPIVATAGLDELSDIGSPPNATLLCTQPLVPITGKDSYPAAFSLGHSKPSGPFSRPTSPIITLGIDYDTSDVPTSAASSTINSPAIFRFDPPHNLLHPTSHSTLPKDKSLRLFERRSSRVSVASLDQLSMSICNSVPPLSARRLSQPRLSIASAISMDSSVDPISIELPRRKSSLLCAPQRTTREWSGTLSELFEGVEQLTAGLSQTVLDDRSDTSSIEEPHESTPTTLLLPRSRTSSEDSSLYTPSVSSVILSSTDTEGDLQPNLRTKRSSSALPVNQPPAICHEPSGINLKIAMERIDEVRSEASSPTQMPPTPDTALGFTNTAHNSLGSLEKRESPPPYSRGETPSTRILPPGLAVTGKVSPTATSSKPKPYIPPHLRPPSTLTPPARLASINLPPARQTRSVLMRDLPTDERASQQWDREKVTSDVRQITQRMQWDKAQKTWQLVREAERVPVIRKREISSRVEAVPQPTLQRTPAHHSRRSMPMLPPGRLEWAFIDSSMPSVTVQSEPAYRVCIAWRVLSGRNTFHHPFGVQDELKVFVLGRTSSEFYDLHQGLLHHFPLEPRRHQWTRDTEIGPLAQASIEPMSPPCDEQFVWSPNGTSWQQRREDTKTRAAALEQWMQGLMRLKQTPMAGVLESDLLRQWMTPKRDGDCERVVDDWRSDRHIGDERIARTLERLW